MRFGSRSSPGRGSSSQAAGPGSTSRSDSTPLPQATAWPPESRRSAPGGPS